MQHVAVLGWALALVSMQPAATDGALELRAAVWHRELVAGEPILVRLEMRNLTDRPLAVVPPYLDCDGRMSWPVDQLSVVGVGGERVASFPHAQGSARYRPMSLIGSEYNGPLGGQVFPPMARRAWPIGPNASITTWTDLSNYWPALAPGVYRLSLPYGPRADMLGRERARLVEGAVWEGVLTFDAGEITVVEADSQDRGALEILAAVPSLPLGTPAPLSARRAREARAELLQRSPDSHLAPYARFYELWNHAEAVGPDAMPYGAKAADIIEEADAFARDTPDFPLNYQVPLIVAVARFLRERGVWGSRDEMARCLQERGQPLIQAAEELGDPRLVDYALEFVHVRVEMARKPATGRPT